VAGVEVLKALDRAVGSDKLRGVVEQVTVTVDCHALAVDGVDWSGLGHGLVCAGAAGRTAAGRAGCGAAGRASAATGCAASSAARRATNGATGVATAAAVIS